MRRARTPPRTKARKRTASGEAELRVADVHAALDAIAPFAHAAEWDNVGLLAGDFRWPARRAMVALDLTDRVAREALTKRIGALVVYHPPIFREVRAVTPTVGGPTGLLPELLAERVAILATHTAFDAAVGGTNDLLLNLFEPVARRPLEPFIRESGDYKLVVFVPPAEVEKLRGTLASAGAGVIGHYTECSFELAGRGSFRGDETTRPTIGRKQVLEHADEVRLEMVVRRERLGDVVRALYAAHSYEEPAFDLYPLHAVVGRGSVGMGRVGTLKQSQRGTTLVRKLKTAVDLSIATSVGDLKRSFGSVTTAAGAFGVRSFCDPDSLVVTGELKHHDALELLRRGVTAICLGHYASERLVLNALRTRLRRLLSAATVTIARSDRAPFQLLRA